MNSDMTFSASSENDAWLDEPSPVAVRPVAQQIGVAHAAATIELDGSALPRRTAHGAASHATQGEHRSPVGRPRAQSIAAAQ